MLTNSYIVHETVNQNQQLTDEYLYRENFYTQEFTTMNNWEGNNYQKENLPVQWHVESENRTFVPDEIVKNTKLRIEAKEFVPRYCLVGNTNINYESTNEVDQSVLYGNYTLASNPEDCNKRNWADEIVENVVECLPHLNSEFYNAEVSDDVPLLQENTLNTVPTRSSKQFVGEEINFNENTEQLESHRNCSVESTNTNQTEADLDKTNQNREKNKVDSYNRNFQPRYQYNKEYNRNWKRDDDNYRPKGKPRYSQSFRDNFPRERHGEQRDFIKRNHTPNSYNQENESSYNDGKPNRRYADRGINNQDRYHNYDKRKNYQRSSPNFIKNNNEAVEIQSSTTKIKSNEEIHQDGNNSDVRVKVETLKEIKITDSSNNRSNQFRHNQIEQEVDEESSKRKWSARQLYDNKEGEESKPINEDKGAKPRNRNYQKGRFTDSRSSSNNRGRKQDERQQEQIEPAENTEIVESGQQKERKSKFYQNSEFRSRKSENNYNKSSNNECFDEEKYKKERNRRFTDTHKSIKYKTKDQSYNDVEDKTSSNRRSFNRDENERRPEKSFRDALFAEKKHDKPRDLKQERGGIKVEITVRYEEFKNRPSAVLNVENLFDEKYGESDPEYKAFLQDLKDDTLVVSEKIKEQNQDLFKMSQDYSLAHCVAEDMRMGSGIAVTFRETFGNVDSLLSMNEKSGGLAILKQCNRFLYYLITKKRSRDKPSYKDFWCSMKRLRDHIKKHQISKLAVPTLGCGLDQLNWQIVKYIISYLFNDIPIEIVVCNFTPNEDLIPRNSIKIHRKNDELKNAKESIIIYFTSADSYISKEMLELNERFSFLDDFKKASKDFGSVIKSKVSDCILCGCVVKKTIKDSFSYKSFSKALNSLNNIILDTACDAIALQHLKEEKDDLLHQKIITLIVNYLNNVEVFVYTGHQIDDTFGDT